MKSTDMPDTHAQSSPNPTKAEQVIDPDFGRTLIQRVTSESVLSLDQVTVGILTALPKEYVAVCNVLGCGKDAVALREGGDKEYRLGVVSGKNTWGYVVAVATLNEMGNVSAAARVTNMLHDCQNLKALIVCGIAGAVPCLTNASDHVRVGDIVVSSEGVLQYDFGKQYPKGFEIKGNPFPPSYELITAVNALKGKELLGERPWERYIESSLESLTPDFVRPSAETDLLCEPNWRDPKRIISNLAGWAKTLFDGNPKYPAIPHPFDDARRNNQPRIFFGLIASASRVLKDQTVREHLRKLHHIKAVEMEAAGAAHACYVKNIGYLVVRGTCDYCNPDKNKVWQEYAVLAAAAYTRSLLEEIDVRVFSSTPRTLTVVQATATMNPVDGDQATLLDEDVAQVMNETQKAASRIGESHASDLPPSTTRNSETTREIPMLDTLAGKDLVAGGISAHRGTRPSDQFMTRPGSTPRSQHVSATHATFNTPELEQQVHHASVDQLSSRERLLLTAEGERYIAQLKELVDTWEFEHAFSTATMVADWISTNESHIEPHLALDMYATLARVEAIRAKRTQEAGQAPDLTLARYYLSKARDA